MVMTTITNASPQVKWGKILYFAPPTQQLRNATPPHVGFRSDHPPSHEPERVLPVHVRLPLYPTPHAQSGPARRLE